jgi:endo-1,4-beta-xylanase
MQRRLLLSGGFGGALLAAASLQAEEASGLDALAQRTGRRFGFAVRPDSARNGPLNSILRANAGVITAENAMKWNHLENAFGQLNYSAADQVAELAVDLKAQLRGHTLAWHQSTPRHLHSLSPAEFEKAQTAHLQALMQRYRGRVDTWDVLNEVIDGDAVAARGVRQSVLSKLWGADRYPALFELARAADPLARLAYNDYGMEQDNAWCERRRSALLRMLESWASRKTPIDAMGLQAHLDLARPFSATRLTHFFDELQAFGLSIQITELDVRDANVPGDIEARDAAVAALYRDFLDACLSHSAVEMIVLWYVTDRESWINHRSSPGARRDDGQPMRPTLFNEAGRRKPAFDAAASALRRATTRFNLKEPRRV